MPQVSITPQWTISTPAGKVLSHRLLALLHMARGKGSHLTPLAEKLVWAGHRIQARLNPMLDTLASERYFFLCDQDALNSERLRLALDILSSASFRAAVNDLPGYSAEPCGQVQTLREAFGSLSDEG